MLHLYAAQMAASDFAFSGDRSLRLLFSPEIRACLPGTAMQGYHPLGRNALLPDSETVACACRPRIPTGVHPAGKQHGTNGEWRMLSGGSKRHCSNDGGSLIFVSPCIKDV